MNITEVRVKRLEHRSDRLRAFCSITIDDELVVHDLRVIEGRKGLFIAMPSRKITDNCPSCGGKNHLRAEFCNSCGSGLDKERARKKEKCHVDVAHPIVTSCRDKIKEAVLDAYRKECAAEEGSGGSPGDDGAWYNDGESDDQNESTMDFPDDDEDFDDDDEDSSGDEETGEAEEAEEQEGGGDEGRRGSRDREDSPPRKEEDSAAGREPDSGDDRESGGGFGEGIL